MTDEMKLAIEVGMRVMVKVAAREIPATVIEVGDAYFLVRSETSGREFRTSRVVDILAPLESTDIAREAEAMLEEEDAVAELRRRRENAANPPPFTMPQMDSDEMTDEENQNKENDTMQEENKEEAIAMNDQNTNEEGIAETAAEMEEAAGIEAENAQVDENADGKPASEETADGKAIGEDDAADDAGAEPDGQSAEATESAIAENEKPKKNLSLVDAAVEVLKAEKRPMKVREMVKLAVERGLWIPTKCKTPEQSLYGGLYLEMKNSPAPKVKKSAEKGKFELA